MFDDFKSVIKNFRISGDITVLLAAKLPPPAAFPSLPPALRSDLAELFQLRFEAQSGFAGLLDRQSAATLLNHPSDPAIARVTALPEHQALVAAREKSDGLRDRASLVRTANAHTTLLGVVGDERLKVAIAADHAAVLSQLDDVDAGKHRRLVLDTLNWVIARTPSDDPQRARRLFERARAKAALNARPGQVLADHRAAAQFALRQRPVWRDLVIALAQYQADLYHRGEALIHLAGALVACRDLAEALRRDLGSTAQVQMPVLDQLREEIVRTLGTDGARWLMTCHRDRDALARQYLAIERLRRSPTNLDVLAQRRDQAWVLTTGLPLDHQDRPAALLGLYFANLDLWEIGGDPDAAALAHDTATEAVLTTSPEHPLRGRLLVAFSHSGMSLAKLTNDVDLAGDAVEAGRAAVGLPTGDSTERALRRSELAYALIAQYALGGDPAAVREAVELAEEAVSLTRADDPDLPLRWAVLCTAAAEAGGAGEPGMLAKAVEAGRRATETIPEGDPRRPMLLNNYADTLKAQAVTTETSDPHLFDQAERALRTALALLEPGHPDHIRFESALADVLYHRYRQCGDLTALRSSLELAEKSTRESARDHPLWPARVLTLARTARELAHTGGPRAEELRRVAISCYRAVATQPSIDVERRMFAEQAQAEMFAEADAASRLDAHERVIAAIPAFVSRTLPTADRQERMRTLDGLADQIIDAGVRSGQVDRALNLIERCRGVLFGDAWGIRRGWVQLREAWPEQAEQLSEIERQLDEADRFAHATITVSEVDGTDPRTVDLRADSARRVRLLAAERDRLLAEVQELPGCQNLLQQPELPALRERLAGHTAVVVSAVGTALIVPPDPARSVEVVPLPGMSEAAARDQLRRMSTALADAVNPDGSFHRRAQAQQGLHTVLEWLWDTTAGPVLSQVSADRLWWCPIGALAGLPLHAAGRHRDRTGHTVFDRVVSSYTPSLTALADTLATPRPSHCRPGALAVGITKVVPELSNAATEATAVANLVGRNESTLLIDEEAELQAVVDGLHRHDIAHFACHHGRVGKSPGQPDLTVGLRLGKSMIVPSFVRDLRTATAQLAFLSACSTANPDPTLLDEPLHLASAFHLAGFRGVIGTLWYTQDSSDTAEAIYSMLTGSGTRPLNPADAAAAVTKTMRLIRDESLASPSMWASQIHIGD